MTEGEFYALDMGGQVGRSAHALQMTFFSRRILSLCSMDSLKALVEEYHHDFDTPFVRSNKYAAVGEVKMSAVDGEAEWQSYVSLSTMLIWIVLLELQT